MSLWTFIAGGARYVVIKPGQAEVAFAVVDQFQGQGVGSALLRHLSSLARKAGLQEFVAEVLAENVPMLKVFEKVGLKELLDENCRRYMWYLGWCDLSCGVPPLPVQALLKQDNWADQALAKKLGISSFERRRRARPCCEARLALHACVARKCSRFDPVIVRFKPQTKFLIEHP